MYKIGLQQNPWIQESPKVGMKCLDQCTFCTNQFGKVLQLQCKSQMKTSLAYTDVSNC